MPPRTVKRGAASGAKRTARTTRGAAKQHQEISEEAVKAEEALAKLEEMPSKAEDIPPKVEESPLKVEQVPVPDDKKPVAEDDKKPIIEESAEPKPNANGLVSAVQSKSSLFLNTCQIRWDILAFDFLF